MKYNNWELVNPLLFMWTSTDCVQDPQGITSVDIKAMSVYYNTCKLISVN